MAKERVFAVFGLGTFGFEVSRVLAEKGGKVIVVDKDAELIEKTKNIVTQAVLIDCTDEEALKNLGLDEIDIAVVAIGEDLNASILTTALLSKLGVPYIISRAITDIHAQVLKQVGATEIINIEINEGQELANRILYPDILENIPISDELKLVEIVTPENFVGKALKNLDLRKKFNVNVISVKRSHTEIDDMGNPTSEEIVFAPTPNDILQQNDIMVLIGSDLSINSLRGA
ncbi:MAG: TrkA family potassium uptake protein [Pseudomonadota bacterium]